MEILKKIYNSIEVWGPFVFVFLAMFTPDPQRSIELLLFGIFFRIKEFDLTKYRFSVESKKEEKESL